MSSIKSTAQHQTPLLSPGNVDGMHTVQISERNSSNPPSSKGVILSVDRANITYPSDICDPFGDEFECISLESTSTCSSNSSNFKFSDNGSDATDDTSDDEETDVNKPFTLQHACVVYEVVGVIGCGGFGEVLQAESSLGDQVAIKVCSKATRGRSAESLSDMIMDERDVLLLTARKEQPFLTQPLACFQDDNNVYYVMVGVHFCASMEPSLTNVPQRLYPKNLAEVIFSGTKFSPPQFKILAAELLLGLEGLHKLRVVHRDLKPDNILVTPNGHIAVADFGLARPFTRKLGPQSLMYEDVGTPGYFAPEFFHLPEGEGYTSAIDTWGFGVILYEAYTGKVCSFYRRLPIITDRFLATVYHSRPDRRRTPPLEL